MSRGIRLSRVRLGLLAVLAGVSLTLLVGSSSASLPSNCVFNVTAGKAVCTFRDTGAEQTFVVPAGVVSVQVVARGAAGAAGWQPGGRGAAVSGALRVTPNQVLYVEVGGAPTMGNLPPGSTCADWRRCDVGGFNGGGSAVKPTQPGMGYGGGGGGASDVRTTTRSDPDTLASRLIVAAGGGGGGGHEYLYATDGGTGGDAGSSGGTARNLTYPPTGTTSYGGTGGGAGSSIAGGTAGTPGGEAGRLGIGGNTRSGGGGGGGLYGGGGGGNAMHIALPGAHVSAGGGGGGGGSNLVPAGGTSGLTSEPAQVTISYALVDTTPPKLTIPSDMTVAATGPAGAAVVYTATATDDNDPNPAVVCTPPSGSVFAIGTTTVNCSATDSSGNTATASFTVHVKGAAEQLADLGHAVKGIGPGTSHAVKASLAVKVRTAELFVAHGNNQAACMTLTAFNLELRALSGRKIPAAQATALIADSNRIKKVLGC